MTIKGLLKAMVPMVLGVIAAGYLLKLGHDNDIPFLKDAHSGFDS